MRQAYATGRINQISIPEGRARAEGGGPPPTRAPHMTTSNVYLLRGICHPIEKQMVMERLAGAPGLHQTPNAPTHFQLPSLVFPSGGSGKQGRHNTQIVCVGLHQNTPSGCKVARQTRRARTPQNCFCDGRTTQHVCRTGLCYWVQLALLPIG